MYLHVDDTCTDTVDADDFWLSVEKEILARGFIKQG